MFPQDALKLLEISANLTANIMQMRMANSKDQPTEDEWKATFSACTDMLQEKYNTLPTCEQELKALDEKFATIGEMHRIFSEKLTDIDKRFAALPPFRVGRRPGG